MKDNIKIEDICEKIWKLEKSFGLLDYSISNIKIWQVLRMPIFIEIGMRTRCIEKPHTNKNKVWDRLKHIASYAMSVIIYNPYLTFARKNVLIFDHNRKYKQDNKYIDIHTNYLIEEMLLSPETFEVYERPYMNKHYSEKEQHRKHLDFILILSTMGAYLLRCTLTEDERNYILAVQKGIFNEFGIDINLLNTFKREINKFKVKKWLYDILLKIKKPHTIYLVVGYGEAPLIKAAKDLNITTIELQHGMFSDYHLGYSYPGAVKNSLDYFPDMLYIWDEFWKDMCELPLTADRIVCYGFRHLEKAKKEYRNYYKKLKQIVVISQGIVGSRLANIVYANIGELTEYKIIYKLHPGEYDRWRDYSSLVKLSNHKNIEIVDHNRYPLYKILAESEFLIGLSSTVIYEALHFNCKIILVDLPGVEHMRKMKDLNILRIIRENDRIIDYL